VVRLRGVTGRAAGGTIATEGDLDFRGDASRLNFCVEVRGLGLRRLPASWGLPAQVDGKLTGRADLAVTVRDGKTELRGSGRGEVSDASLAGFRARGPIPLILKADGRRLNYSSPSPWIQTLLFAAPALGRAGRPAPGRRSWE